MTKVKKIAGYVADVAAFIVTPQGRRDVALVIAAVGTIIQIVRASGVF
jgi:hypothetical protein